MPWFKVDDRLHDHFKARQAGKAAMGVWDQPRAIVKREPGRSEGSG